MNGNFHNSQMPLITVGIPAYNHEKYVEESIRSVLEQDYPRIELLVVDDASPDKTWEIIKSLQDECEEKCERVIFDINETNQGTCFSLNKLKNNCRGDFFILMASDDKLLPGALSALIKPMLLDERIGVVVGQNQIIDSDSRRCFWDANRNNIYTEKGAAYKTFNGFLEATTGIKENSPLYGKYESLLKANHIPNGYLMRFSELIKIPSFSSDAPLEDHWLHLQLSKITAYKAIPNDVFSYRWHNANTVHQTSRMMWMDFKTREYEKRMVLKKNEEPWARIFLENEFTNQLIFSIPKIIRCVRISNYKSSYIEISFFKIKIKVRKHILKIDDSKKSAYWS